MGSQTHELRDFFCWRLLEYDWLAFYNQPLGTFKKNQIIQNISAKNNSPET